MFGLFRKQKESPPQSVLQANLFAENIKLKKDLSDRDVELKQLRLKTKEREYIDVSIGDPSPKDKVNRAEYVAKVAGLHKDVLEPKLKQIIGNTRALLEASDNPRDYDLTLKGAAYAFWEILRWGELMISEQVSNQTNQNPSLPDEQVNQ